MKTIVESINTNKPICAITQYETNKGSAYCTFDISNAYQNYKYGYIYYNTDDEFVSIDGIRNMEEFEDLMGVNEGDFEELENMNIGESYEWENGTFVRIW